jgi:D-xylose transport system substrate-binding protein
MIGLSLPGETIKRWARDGKAMEEEADMLGIPIRVKIADDSEENQKAQIEELILEGARILIIAPINSSGLEEQIQKAKSLGIIVIAYDRLILNTDIDAYVSFNSLRVGQLQGRYLIEKVPQGNYVIISGDPNDNNSRLLKEGAMEYIQPRVLQRYINIVQDAAALNWSPEVVYNIVKNALQANNNRINAVLAPNDDTAGGAIRALNEQGLAGQVQVTGQDANLEAARRIVNGTQGMTVFKDTRELGKEAINTAVKLSRGEALDAGYITNNGKIDVPSILLTPVLVDINNLDRVLIDSGYLNKDEVYERNNFVK